MGADANDVSAQEDQDISTHLERGDRREEEVIKLTTGERKGDTANSVR